MNEEQFRALVLEEWSTVPSRFKDKIHNVALLIEDTAHADDSLLGLYQGIPQTKRGSEYGVGATVPDTITLYRLPILKEAEERTDTDKNLFREMVRRVVKETIWHEIGHYFGLEEEGVQEREEKGTNRFS